MNAQTALPVAALGVAGLALVLQLSSGDDAKASTSSSSSSAVTSSHASSSGPRGERDLEGRVRALESEVRTLRLALRDTRRGAGLTVQSAGRAPTARPDNVPAAQLDAETAAAAIVDAIDNEDTEVKERIEGLVNQQMQKERERRWEMRAQRWAERREEQVQTLVDENGLDEEQAQKLGSMLAAEQEQMMAIFKKAREEMRWREARQQAREIRAETDDNAKALLDDEQFERFEQMREEDRPGRGRGRGRDAKDKKRE